MMYQWIILGVLALAVAGLLTLGLRSRARQNEYLGTGVERDLSAPSPVPSPERQRAEARLAEIADRSEAVSAPPVEPIAEQVAEAQPEPASQPAPIASPWVATPPVVQPRSDEPADRITGADQIESDYDEAELMLREVKAMLLQGRPDRAIAHIRAATGVDYDHAAEFVADVQSRVIG